VKVLCEATFSALERHQRQFPKKIMQRILHAQHARETIAAERSLADSAQSSADAFKQLVLYVPRLATAYITGRVPTGNDARAIVQATGSFGTLLGTVRNYGATKLFKPKEADFVSIFELLEEIAQLPPKRTLWNKIWREPGKPLLPPIVIIREIQRLDNLQDDPALGRKVFGALFEYFEPCKQGQSHVPVIIETSDFLWSRMKQIMSSQESFKAKQMGSWCKEEAEEWLVKRTLEGQPAPVFTQDEFDKIWDFSGGHAGTIYLIHSGLIAGTSLEQTIDEIRLEVDGSVRNIVRDGNVPAVIAKRKDFLRKLCSAGYKLETPDEPSGEMYFLQSNVLFSDGVSVCPRNKIFEGSIDRYLNPK